LDSGDHAPILAGKAATTSEMGHADSKITEGSGGEALLILGMHRSGTSSIAGAMVRLGGAAPLNLLPPADDNPKGFFESSILMTLNDRILAAGGSHWEDWRQFDPARIDAAAASELKGQAKSALAGEFGRARLAVIKDPRMCRLMPFWSSVFREANWSVRPVLQLRSPLEVAMSLNRRDGMPLALGCLLWLRHVLDAEASTRGMPRSVVDWNDFLNDPRRTLGRVSEQLRVVWPQWSDGALAEIDEFVSADMRRQRASDSDLQVHPVVNHLVREAYAAVRELVENPASGTVGRTLENIAERFDSAAAIFGHAMGELERGSRQAKSAAVALRAEHATQLSAAREEFARQLSEASSQFADTRTEFADTRTELADTRTALADTRTELAEARTELADTRTELADTRAELADTRTELADTRTELADTRTDFADTRTEFADTRTELADAKRKIARAEDMLAYVGHRYGRRGAPKLRFRDYLRPRRKKLKELTAVRDSAFFDREFYLDANPDVRTSGMDAALHYLVCGGHEGRDPSPFFSTHEYLAAFPDVAASGMNALAHYEMYGRRERRKVPLTMP
jgi:hypothetical protein